MTSPHVRRILVPVDFGPESEVAVDAAVGLARLLSTARVEVLHAYQVDIIAHADFVWIPTAADVSRVIAHAEDMLHALVARKRDLHPHVAIRGRLVTGAPRDAVVASIRREAPDLVVQGTHGRGFWSRAVLGSVAQEIITHCQVPVLSVRCTDPPPSFAQAPKCILVPVDFSPGSDQALDYAVDLASRLGSRVRVLFCYEEPQPLDVYVGLSFWTDVERNAASGLRRLVDAHVGAGVAMETAVRRGALLRQIVKESEVGDVGLVVMPLHGKNADHRFLLGRVARDIVRLSPSPVVTLLDEVTSPSPWS